MLGYSPHKDYNLGIFFSFSMWGKYISIVKWHHVLEETDLALIRASWTGQNKLLHLTPRNWLNWLPLLSLSSCHRNSCDFISPKGRCISGPLQVIHHFVLWSFSRYYKWTSLLLYICLVLHLLWDFLYQVILHFL